VAIAVVTFGLGLPWWAWVLCLLGGTAAGAALMLDSWRRDRERKEFLIALLATRQAKSPTFDRLLERAKLAGIDPRSDGPPGVHKGRPSRLSSRILGEPPHPDPVRSGEPEVR
jgi:hypothetical protein